MEQSPNAWQKIDSLFQQALDKPLDERESFLAAQCGDDAQLLQKVKDLLGLLEQETILDRPLVRTQASLWKDALVKISEGPRRDTALKPGDMVGPYEIIGEIGRGGMAVVYQAERADGLFRKTVALKVIKRGTDTDDVVLRFSYERKILGSLDHPNIASVFDGGVTKDGRPYFVMEFVDGQPITRYSNSRKLDLRARLQLFSEVARAVQHAHRNLVVHRDLKPSNIMVSENGKVQLLDFGVAKLLRPELAEERGVVTSTGRLFLTPQYASPELVTGQSMSTSSDIYQLGLVLYELLTGTTPYVISTASRSEIERTVCNKIPPRPSVVISRGDDGDKEAPTYGEASGSKWSRALQGDLDNIVMKAMSKEPEERYESAQRLAEDIERYLEGKPVVARDATWHYRTKKYLWRNRWYVAATVLIAATITAYIATYASQALRIKQEVHRAQVEASKSETVAAFMMGLFESYGPNTARGGTVDVDQILTDGLDKADRDLVGQPEVQQEIYYRIGSILNEYGEYAEAKAALLRAAQLAVVVNGEAHPLVAESNALLGWIMFKAGEREEGESLLRQTLQLQQRILPPGDVRLAVTLSYLGSIAHEAADYERAETLFTEALWLRERKFGDSDISIAETFANLGYVLQLRDKDEEAEDAYKRAVGIAEAIHAGDNTKVAEALHGMGSFLVGKRNYSEAENYLLRALAMRQRLFGDSHPQIAANLSGLGILYSEMKDFDRAAMYYEQSFLMRSNIFGDDHITVANSRHQLGWLYYETGDYQAAEEYLAQAYQMYVTLLGSEHDFVGSIQNRIALCLVELERYAEAEAVFNSALANRIDRHGRQSQPYSMVLNNLGVLRTRIGRLDQAETDLRTALEIRLELLGEGHWRTHQSYRDLGHNLALQKKLPEARDLLEKSVTGLAASRGLTDDHTVLARQYLASLPRSN